MAAEFSQNRFLPNPDDVAYRASVATGRKELDPFTVLDDGIELKTTFDIATGFFGMMSLDRAMIKTERRQDDGQVAESVAEIGNYDPYDQQWKFYPEMIEYESWGALGEFFDLNVYLEKLDEVESKVEVGCSRFLVRDPFTILARKETGKLLAKTGVAERIIREFANQDIQTYTFDEATSCYLSLPAACLINEERLSYHAAHNGYTPLGLNYIGLCQQEGSLIKRVSQLYEIARLPADTREWEPNADYIHDSREWDYLRQVPELLQDYTAQDKRFSVQYNTVIQQS